MCFVSFVGDSYSQTFPHRWPGMAPYVQPNLPTITITQQPEVNREEFEALRKEIEELRLLLIAAKHFDEVTGQPDCEMDEKVDLIRRLAELVGVDLDDIFDASPA